VSDPTQTRPPRIKRAHEGHGFTHDEQGNRSMGRVLLFATTLYIFGAIAVATLTLYKLPGEAWLLLSSMEGAFTIWVAGPRIAQYLAPVVQKGIESLADLIKKRRDPVAGVEATP